MKESSCARAWGSRCPSAAGARLEGVLAVGERVSGAPFSEEDHDFAQTLARQAVAALESARLHRMQVEKQRQDRELQIAREIQQSLFPSGCPELDGFEVAAESRPCHEVGGDHYDFISLGEGRLALAVADVSGKGTPASILMASVHASLQALAGTASPAVVMERVNRFLFASTQANKYATLFYAELDPAPAASSTSTRATCPPTGCGVATARSTGCSRGGRRWACSRTRRSRWGSSSWSTATSWGWSRTG